MTFPEYERVIYEKNPLVEVISQLRFPTILKIAEKEAADFQDRIRDNYPLYSQAEPAFDFPPDLPKELAAIAEQMHFSGLTPPVHRFDTKDKKRFISLSRDFVALVETQYKKWDLFREEFVKVEAILRDVYKPAFYSRIGLRYRDVISRHALNLEGVDWSDLLQPQILAELGDKALSSSVTSTQTRTVVKIDEVPNAQIIMQHGLIINKETSEQCYFIDADFSIKPQEEIDAVFGVLDQFNRLAGKLFRWAITSRLHLAMGPKAV